MAILKNNSKLSEIVVCEPSSITVLNRFNIYLGFGDKTIEDVCKENNLEADFITTILNTYINEDYFPVETLKSYSIGTIIEYFRKTYNYYLRFQIPNIERHFSSLITRSENGNNNLSLLYNFFQEVKNEILHRIDDDMKTFFPEIEMGILSQSNKLKFQEGDNSIEDKINDLINMFVIHLNGEYDVNLCHAVLFAILSFQKDIRQNNRIRNRILYSLINTSV